ncbi:MAG: PRC-barrel domain-containing protein [Candidatus Micrarchaeia archaeon]
MSMRLSRIYGMDIYTDGGKFFGRVQDVIVDLERGEVVRLTTEPLTSITRDEAKRILREKSLLYKSVKSVEDVVVVSGGQVGQQLPSSL